MRRTFTTADGLAQNTVISITQTRDGYMWFGTQEGLSRYNGHRFLTFRRKRTPGLSSDYITHLYEDSSGVLWIGSRGGIIRWQSGHFLPITRKQGMPSDIVLCVLEGLGKRLWVGTDQGLCVIRNGHVEVESWSLGYRISTMCQTRDGNIWLGTDRGLYRWTGKEWLFQRLSGSIGQLYISTMAIDSTGNLWIGTDEGHIYCLDQNSRILLSFPRISGGNQITSLKVDSDGILWITTDGGGLLRLNGDRIETWNADRGIPTDFIDCVYEDREGSLWFGTHKGIFLLQNSRFTVWTTIEGLAYDFISAVSEDDRGNLLVGTYAGGLDRIDFSSGNRVYHFHDLPARKISAILVDREKRLWVGTRGEGLWVRQNRSWKQYTVRQGLASETVWVIHQDNRGIIWIGTNKGLNRFDGRSFEKFGTQNGLRNDNIYALLTDPENGMWVGTAGGGLYRWSEKESGGFIRQANLSDDVILSLFRQNDGVIWVGTSFGLNRLEGSRVTVYTEDTGLADNVIFSLLDDGRGYLWMSSNRGLSRVSWKDLGRLHRKECMKIICDRYGVDDGMKNPECNGGFQPAAWKTSEQKLYFPTVDGLVGVDPGMVDEPGIPPGVHIENIKSNGKMISSHPGMTIGPGVNRLEFHYTSLSYRLPGQLRFRFKLDGYDREWEVVEGSSDRLAVYRYLPPGQYCFQVQAGLDRAGWGLSSTRFEFTVLPYFWQTGWFKLLVAIAFAILSFFLITGIRKFLGIVHFWKRKTRIGNYRIVRKLGSGGMGTVYLARSLHASGRQVALKVLREEFTTDDIQIRRLEQEAMIIDQINHANIVNVIERGRHDQNIYIAMEYLQGITLAGLISRKGKATVSEGIHILKQVALALRVIHRKSIVHRDLKPDNIMIIRKPQDPLFVKVLDFGLARSESFTRLTESGIVLGTIAYLAPEQIRENRFSPASDVYSLGVTAYESFTGKRPFDGTSSMELMNKILNDTPDDPGLLNPDLPQDLNVLILRMMSRDISLRPDINDIVRVFSVLDPESPHHPTTPIHKLR